MADVLAGRRASRPQPGHGWSASSGTEGEGASVGGGGGAGGSGEVPAKVGGGAETTGVRHLLDGKVGLLQQLAGERSWRLSRVLCEPGQVQWFVEVFQRPVAGG